MVFTSSKKHSHQLSHINLERVNCLERKFLERASIFDQTNYIIGGGWSIPYLLKIYQKALETKGDTPPQKTIQSWMPDNINSITNGYYRNHNGILHVLCFEEDLSQIVESASKHNLTLVHRKRDITIWKGKKAEESIPVTPEKMIEISRRKAKEWLTSNAVRLTNLKDSSGEDYCDLFIHHYVDADRQEVKRIPEGIFIRESDDKQIKQEELNVEAYKDKGLMVKLEHFQPLIYRTEDLKVNIANPYYMFQVKKKAFEKRKFERDGVDLDILERILEFAKINPIEDQLRLIREGL